MQFENFVYFKENLKKRQEKGVKIFKSKRQIINLSKKVIIYCLSYSKFYRILQKKNPNSLISLILILIQLECEIQPSSLT